MAQIKRLLSADFGPGAPLKGFPVPPLKHLELGVFNVEGWERVRGYAITSGRGKIHFDQGSSQDSAGWGKPSHQAGDIRDTKEIRSNEACKFEIAVHGSVLRIVFDAEASQKHFRLLAIADRRIQE
jgi:hypothetical protein